MKRFLADLIQRLTSRKFLLTVAAALVLVANQQWVELVALLGGYMGVEGAGDLFDRVQRQKTEQAKVQQQTTFAQLTGEVPDGFSATGGKIVPGLE